ncbi:MAG: hypothetical protein ACREPM_03625 [Gemmatimonadaceae bacterium]
MSAKDGTQQNVESVRDVQLPVEDLSSGNAVDRAAADKVKGGIQIVKHTDSSSPKL